MTDYTELVKALRILQGKNSLSYYKRQVCKDAADAIEALQAENPIVETVLVDKMRQQMEETVCHCNVKENAELIAKILDDDVDRKVFELPKRGEVVRCRECRWVHICRIGQHLGLDGFCSKGEREVQE